MQFLTHMKHSEVALIPTLIFFIKVLFGQKMEMARFDLSSTGKEGLKREEAGGRETS